jgi:hypothetical protein
LLKNKRRNKKQSRVKIMKKNKTAIVSNLAM